MTSKTMNNAFKATFNTEDDEVAFLSREEVGGVTIVGVRQSDGRSEWIFRLSPYWDYNEAKDQICNIERIFDEDYEAEFFGNIRKVGIAYGEDSN